MDLLPAREAVVGGTALRRLLPHPRCRRIGAWCFLDHYGPTAGDGGTVGAHPHTGLQTFTWLLEGRLVHGDSTGSHQPLVPGQLNLMTAGRGVVHWEEAVGTQRMHGVQLWIALPDAHRQVEPAFEHHATLPETRHGGAVTTVLIGEHAGLSSPARAFTPIVGLDLSLSTAAPAEIPLRPDFEHALITLDGTVVIGGEEVRPGQLAVLGTGQDAVVLRGAAGARAMILGGAPFEESLLMWWNWVGRTRADIEAADAEWERLRHERWPMESVPAPPVPTHLLPR